MSSKRKTLGFRNLMQRRVSNAALIFFRVLRHCGATPQASAPPIVKTLRPWEEVCCFISKNSWTGNRPLTTPERLQFFRSLKRQIQLFGDGLERGAAPAPELAVETHKEFKKVKAQDSEEQPN
jgi:hypothetical protein